MFGWQTAETRSIRDYYYDAHAAVRNRIHGQDDSYILGVEMEDFANFLYEELALPSLEKDPSRDVQASKMRRMEELRDLMGRPVLGEVTVVRVEYPLVPHPMNKQTLDLMPSMHEFNPVQIEYDERQAVIVFETTMEAEDLGGRLAKVEQWLSWRNKDIEEGNAQLRLQIPVAIKERKQQVAEQKDQLDSILKKVNVKLKARSGSENKVVDLTVRREIRVMRQPPAARRPEEWVLEIGQVLTVIDVIDRTGREFETAPLSYSKLEEEDLRNIILSHLNTVFEGGATGETFSKTGKTDIYLVIPKGGILVAECKYWDGPKAYGEAIDQLFRYLTWRHTYAIVVTFSRNKDFSNVLVQAGRAIQGHGTYQAGFQKVADTHFESTHGHPDDPARTVDIHHLLYTLYSGT
jgi:hypothetical protein